MCLAKGRSCPTFEGGRLAFTTFCPSVARNLIMSSWISPSLPVFLASLCLLRNPYFPLLPNSLVWTETFVPTGFSKQPQFVSVSLKTPPLPAPRRPMRRQPSGREGLTSGHTCVDSPVCGKTGFLDIPRAQSALFHRHGFAHILPPLECSSRHR